MPKLNGWRRGKRKRSAEKTWVVRFEKGSKSEKRRGRCFALQSMRDSQKEMRIANELLKKMESWTHCCNKRET